MDEEAIKAEIRTILGTYAGLAVDVNRLSDSDDLFTAGLTSLKSVNVMLALEDYFNVEFPNEMLIRSTFQTVEAMLRAVRSLDRVPA